ncbi:MAG: hypothetical protein QOK05_555 [Chloroflexota bacterium]|jgi:uncharacterized protein (TIGR02453 family)|nr:hypothetical protein [Chloroflexota bacterium]
MAVATAHFSPALFDFLRQLKKNNNRDWFLKNKARYEADVKGPALRFIEDAGPGLRKISKHLVADPRPVGGSLFRVNRDIRFSNDKSPYKTAVGMSFGHDMGREMAAPGFYLHLDTDDAFAGGGVHMPDTPTLNRVRDAIVGDTATWKRVVNNARFAPMAVNMGEALKRPPQGYDPNHPFVEDLKRKSYTWHARYTQADVVAPDFMQRYLEACRTAAPYTAFLAKALGVPW